MNTKTAEITALAKAFSGRGIHNYKFRIDADGTVRVWDSLAGHYTTCHCMSLRTQARVRDLAAK